MLFMLAALLQAAVPAPLPMPPLHGGPQEMICPVGGESFPAWRPTSFSTYGERPDGKPYSYLPFPFPVPECPGNKLVAFDEFSPAEVAQLAGLIATDEYKRLAETETSYFRAYWLAGKLGRPQPQALELLLSAIWQVSPGEMTDPSIRRRAAQMARYQIIFVSGVRQLSSAVPATDRTWLLARAANAARQMKQFSQAERLRQQAESSLAELPEKRDWATYLATLKNVIARRDASIEPLDMIPEEQVAAACARRQPQSAFDRTACAQPKVAARIAELQKAKQ